MLVGLRNGLLNYKVPLAINVRNSRNVLTSFFIFVSFDERILKIIVADLLKMLSS